jgi:hypothetical protein
MPDTPSPGGATPPSSDPGTSATLGGRSNPDGATPEGQQQSGTEGATPDTPLGEAGREALEKERTARRDAERQLTEYRNRLTEAQEAGLPELERTQSALKRAEAEREAHQTRVSELEAQVRELTLRDMRRQVAQENNLPPDAVDRLQGDDLRSLRADATKLAGLIQAGTPVGSLGIGHGAAATGKPGRVDMTTLIREASGRG